MIKEEIHLYIDSTILIAILEGSKDEASVFIDKCIKNKINGGFSGCVK